LGGENWGQISIIDKLRVANVGKAQ
jgi:hypothetical protein